MKRLILMRHAKSSWDDPTVADHDRPLSARGRASARGMGDWLHKRNHLPDQALSSSATRTRETFAGLGLSCEVAFLKNLYHAGPEQMLRILRQAKADNILILGHNPGIGQFAQTVLMAPPPHTRFYDYPTGATLVAGFDIDSWAQVSAGAGRALDFVIPRELTR